MNHPVSLLKSFIALKRRKRIGTFRSIRDLTAAVIENIDNFDTFSFDIFDTLTVRRISHPDDIKIPVCRFIARKLIAASQAKWNASTILRERNRIESEHRIRNGEKGQDKEACYPDFMEELLRLITGDTYTPALLQEVLDYELEVEQSMLVPRVELVSILRTLEKENKRLLLISDMYLPASALQKLLDKIGIPPVFEKIYSSADHLEAKASGAAWSRLRGERDLDPARWMHIGDNWISDGIRAAEFGITAGIIRDHEEMIRKRKRRKARRSAHTLRSRRYKYVELITEPLEGEIKKSPDFFYSYGYSFLAPILCTYIHELAIRARRDGIDHVYFQSREGRLLQAVWQQLTPSLFETGTLPESSYLRVSRTALAPAACHTMGLTEDLFSLALKPRENHSLRDVLRVYSLPAEALSDYLEQHGLNLDTPVDRQLNGQDPRVIRLLKDDDFQQTIIRHTADAHRGLIQHLDSTGFFRHSKVALVDIGWVGTIQRLLYRSIHDRAECPELHGYLLANTTGCPFPYSNDNQLTGLLYDERSHTFAGSLLSLFRVQMEEMTQAPEPSLAAYAVNNDDFRLVYESRDNEKTSADDRKRAAIMQAVMDYVPRYAAAINLTGYQPEELHKGLHLLLLKHIVFPDRNELEQLSRFHHVNDLVSQESTDKPIPWLYRTLWNTPAGNFPFSYRLRQIYYLGKFLAFNGAARVITRLPQAGRSS